MYAPSYFYGRRVKVAKVDFSFFPSPPLTSSPTPTDMAVMAGGILNFLERGG
jgi:hypothetical protein